MCQKLFWVMSIQIKVPAQGRFSFNSVRCIILISLRGDIQLTDYKTNNSCTFTFCTFLYDFNNTQKKPIKIKHTVRIMMILIHLNQFGYFL